MQASYSFVLSANVAEEFNQLTLKQRNLLMSIFRALAANPYLKDERVELDCTNRELQIKAVGPWSIRFWSDHAVKEVRIIGFQNKPANSPADLK